MTQAEFDKLPGLISRAMFMAITGLKWYDLDGPDGLRAKGKVRVYKRKRYSLYYKADAAPWAGFKV